MRAFFQLPAEFHFQIIISSGSLKNIHQFFLACIRLPFATAAVEPIEITLRMFE